MHLWGYSSTGRATALQAEDRGSSPRFSTNSSSYSPVERTPPWYGGNRGSTPRGSTICRYHLSGDRFRLLTGRRKPTEGSSPSACTNFMPPRLCCLKHWFRTPENRVRFLGGGSSMPLKCYRKHAGFVLRKRRIVPGRGLQLRCVTRAAMGPAF